MNRPMLWVGVAFAAGTFAAAQGFCAGLLVPVLLQLAGLAAPQLIRKRIDLRTVSVVLCFFGLGAFLWNLRMSGPPGDPLSRYAIDHPGESLALEGRIRATNIMLADGKYTSFELAVDRVTARGQTFALEGHILVRWAKTTGALLADQQVRITGVVDQNIGHVNPDIGDFEEYYRSKGIQSVTHIYGEKAVEHLGPPRRTSLAYWASRLRNYQAERLHACLPSDIEHFVFAVWLGDRVGMADTEYQSYVESGTAHILSVSGIHMAIVFTTFAFLVRMYVRSRRLRSVLALVVVLMFTVMSGARLATVRSAVMIAAYLMYDFFEREPDAKTALSWSGLLVLLADPTSLFDAGFQLSFLSVASILIYSESFTKALEPAPRIVRSAVGVSLAAQLLPLPLALRIFHLIPLVAPLANLFIVPLLSGVLWLTFATAFFAMFSHDVGLIFGNALAPLVYLIRYVAGLTAQSVLLPSPTLVAMAIYWGTVVWLGLAPVAKESWPTRAGVGLLLFTLMVLCWQPLSAQPRVVFLDVGHGDATFVQTPGGTTLVIDGGDRYSTLDYGARVVAPYLWANHLTSVDYVVATHPDKDHIGGLLYVLQQFRVGTVIMGAVATGDPLEAELLELCRWRNIPVWRVQRGEEIPVEGATLSVLHPTATWSDASGINNTSVVLRLAWPGLSVLFAGDIERLAENSLEPGAFQADIVRAPHHGSKTSSSPSFVRGVGARHVILSTGPMSGRTITDPDVVQRYVDQGASVWRTDFDGGITVTTKDGELLLEGARERRGYLVRPSGQSNSPIDITEAAAGQ